MTQDEIKKLTVEGEKPEWNEKADGAFFAKDDRLPAVPSEATLTATCLNNLGMTERFDVGTSYPMERLADGEMLLMTDKNGEPVEVMRERFRFDEPLATPVPPFTNSAQTMAVREVAAGLEKLRSLQKDGKNHQRIADAALKLEQIIESLSKGEPAKAGPKTNFEVQIESKIKELDEKIEKLLAVVGKYDKLKNPDRWREYRDALAELDPLLNEREKLLVDESRFKARQAEKTTWKAGQFLCETCVKWRQDSGSETVGVCTSFHGENSNRAVVSLGSCGHYQPLLSTENKAGYP